MLNRIVFWMRCICSVPMWPIYRYVHYAINQEDLRQWVNVLIVRSYSSEFLTFIHLFADLKEYRSVLLWRCGLSWLPCPQQSVHFVVSPDKVKGGEYCSTDSARLYSPRGWAQTFKYGTMLLSVEKANGLEIR
jgi:hypothetical protein